MDFAAGTVVLDTGQRHATVAARAVEQAGRFIQTRFQVAPYEAQVALARRLDALAPAISEDAARHHGRRCGLQRVPDRARPDQPQRHRGGGRGRSRPNHLPPRPHQQDHARHGGFRPVTRRVSARHTAGFGPFPASIFRALCPARAFGIGTEEALAPLAMLFGTDAEPSPMAAVVVEPELGEGGHLPLPFDCLQELRRICDRHGILVLAEAVQTDFGRTGRWFALEHSALVPALNAVAEGLAGGWPLAGIIGRAEVMDAVPPGGLGGNYGAVRSPARRRWA